MTLILVPESIILQRIRRGSRLFCESSEMGKDDKDKVKGVLKGGLKLGKAGLQLTSKVHRASSQVAMNGILAYIKHKYPGLGDVLNAASMVKMRVKVLIQFSFFKILSIILDNDALSFPCFF